MKKLWLLLYYSFTLILFFADFFQELDIMKNVGVFEAILNLILIFFYVSYKKSKFMLIDLYLIEALLFTIAGGILLLFFVDKQLLMFINTVGFYLTQFMFINILGLRAVFYLR